MHFDGKYSFEAEVVDKAEKQPSWFKISNFLKKIRNASRQQSEELGDKPNGGSTSI